MSHHDEQHRRPRQPLFLKPVDADEVLEEGSHVESGSADSASCSFVHSNPYLAMSIQQQRSRLPIAKHKNQLLYLLEKHQVVVVVGETGCGKSTQLPQYLVEAGWTANNGQQICVTQPRRVAAVTLAARVAEEMMTPLGSDAGYVVRFAEMVSDRTSIKYVTDGILLRELMVDPLLTAYSVVMVDEAHERSVNTDLICGLLRKIIAVRPDLRLIISSATIDAEFFRDFFELNQDESKNNTTSEHEGSSTIISVEGRMFPVQVLYTKNGVPDYVKATVDLVLNIHRQEGSGDILAFLTGQDEVERACSELRQAAASMKRGDSDKLVVLPLYAGLPPREQFRVFDSAAYQTRKVVLATNVAETSVTIPGVCYVIDCGFVKMRVHNAKSGLDTLMVVAVSKSSADQRAGRAGRVRPGKCYRLYPEAEYERMALTTPPEINRGDLSPTLLQLKALGIHNVLKFHYLSRPSSASMIRALHLLYALGAIDDEGALTRPLGFQMAELPLSPMHAKVLLASSDFECSSEIAIIVAMMQVKDVFHTPSDQRRHKTELSRRSFAVAEGDHLTMLNIFTAFVNNGKSPAWCSQNHLDFKVLCRADTVREQLTGYLKRFHKPVLSCRGTIGETAKIRRCLLSGFFPQVARYDHTGLYVTVRGEYSFKAYKGSALMYREEYPKFVMFSDVMQNSIKDLSEIEPAWLEQLASHYYEFGTVCHLFSAPICEAECWENCYPWTGPTNMGRIKRVSILASNGKRRQDDDDDEYDDYDDGMAVAQPARKRRRVGIFSSARFSEPMVRRFPQAAIDGAEQDIARLVRDREPRKHKRRRQEEPQNPVRRLFRGAQGAGLRRRGGDDGGQELIVIDESPPTRDYSTPGRGDAGGWKKKRARQETNVAVCSNEEGQHEQLAEYPSMFATPTLMAPERRREAASASNAQGKHWQPQQQVPLQEIRQRVLLSFPKMTLQEDEAMTYAQAVSGIASRALSANMQKEPNDAQGKPVNVSLSRLLRRSPVFSNKSGRRLNSTLSTQQSGECGDENAEKPSELEEDEDPTRYVFDQETTNDDLANLSGMSRMHYSPEDRKEVSGIEMSNELSPGFRGTPYSDLCDQTVICYGVETSVVPFGFVTPSSDTARVFDDGIFDGEGYTPRPYVVDNTFIRCTEAAMFSARASSSPPDNSNKQLDESTLKTGREACYNTRDLYFECLLRHRDEEKRCRSEFQAFKANCPRSWVDHFVRKRKLDRYKEKLADEGPAQEPGLKMPLSRGGEDEIRAGSG